MLNKLTFIDLNGHVDAAILVSRNRKLRVIGYEYVLICFNKSDLTCFLKVLYS